MDKNEKPSLTVTRIPKLNTIVLKQRNGNFFVSTKDSFIIDIQGLSFLIKFLVHNNILSHRVLEGILDEYYSSRQL
jgi:hypothetical protein